MSTTRRQFIERATASGVLVSVASLARASAALADDSAASKQVTSQGDAAYDISETVESDVVVIGAGSAGLETALSALRAGLSVTLFSRSAKPVSRGGSNSAVYSRLMEQLGLPRMEGDRFIRQQLANGGYDVNTAMWYRWYNNSEESMDWLLDELEAHGKVTPCIEMGNNEDTPTDDPNYAPHNSHAFNDADHTMIGGGQQSLVEALAEIFVQAGGRIDYQVEAEKLIRGEVPGGTEGRVGGAIGKRIEDGTYVRYNAAKAVVMATGDFSGNRELMEQHCPNGVKYIDNWNYENFDPDDGMYNGGLYAGKGHLMGLEVGAAWQRTFPNCIMAVCQNFDNTVSGSAYSEHSGLLVDVNANRFCNERLTISQLLKVQEHLKGQKYFTIMDSAYPDAHPDWVNAWTDKGAYGDPYLMPDEVRAMWDEYGVKKADTIEGLADELGLPAEQLAATVAKYNEACDAGQDDEFHKDASLLTPIKTAPFYGTAVEKPVFLTVLGGLRTNVDMQVCDDDDEPIPGLYNVGTMVGDFFSGYYTFLVDGHNYGACCLTFGYLTGKHIAEHE